MLHIFRSAGIKNIVYGILIIATSVVFVIQFRAGGGQSQAKSASLSETCVANVRGDCVTPKDFNAAYRVLVPRGEGVSRAETLKIKKIALDGLVERELLIDEAERLGIAVSEEEADDLLIKGFVRLSIPTDDPKIAQRYPPMVYAGFKNQKTKEFDLKTYETTVKNLTGRAPKEFKEQQLREALAYKMRELIRTPVRVSDAEAWDAYERQNTTASVRFAVIDERWAARWAVAWTDKDVEAWAKDHGAEIDKAMEERKKADLPKEKTVRHILAKFPANGSADEKGVALAKISEAHARLKKGEPFAVVARDLSDDPGSRDKGGAYEDSQVSGFVKPFQDAYAALKAGETTKGAVETDFGYHLITKDDPAKAAEVEGKLRGYVARELYIHSKVGEATKSIAARVQADVKGGKSLEDAVKAAVASFVKPAPLPEPLAILQDTPATADAGAPAAGDAGVAATDASAGAGDAGAAAKGDGGASKADAGAAKPAVTLKAFTAESDADRPQVDTSSTFNTTGDPIQGAPFDVNVQILKFAFTSKDGDVMPEPVKISQHSRDQWRDGPTVVQLKEHHGAQREDFEKQKDTVLAGLLGLKQTEVLATYVKRLREAAKAEIKIDESYIKDPPAVDGGAPAAPTDEEEF